MRTDILSHLYTAKSAEIGAARRKTEQKPIDSYAKMVGDVAVMRYKFEYIDTAHLTAYPDEKITVVKYIIRFPDEREPRYINMALVKNTAELNLALPGVNDVECFMHINCKLEKTSNGYTIIDKPYFPRQLDTRLGNGDYIVLSKVLEIITKTEIDKEYKTISETILKTCPKK